MHSGDGVHGADTFMYAVRIIAQDGAPKVMRRPDARGASTVPVPKLYQGETQEMWILEFTG
jgi:hypothetical protein